jgi:glycosyltransferase involved in cell wall biosynthesis
MTFPVEPVGECTKRSAGPRIRDVGVIALVPEEWTSMWQVRHAVLSRLGLYFFVVWVNPAHERNEIGSRLRERQPSVAAVPGISGLFVYTAQWWLPKLYRPPWLERRTFRQRLACARRVLLSQGCTDVVIYIWRPEFSAAVDLIPHVLSCYHIDDEYSFSPVETPLAEQELRLIQRVDQVFIHSPAMWAKKGGLNPHSVFAPNGVDYAAFSRPLEVPEDLQAIPPPRIGYTGSLKKQLDWRLLLDLSALHPEWSFIFVGPRSPHPDIAHLLDEMSQRPNVHFLGEKTVQELAAYPQHFDACVMPYVANAYTHYIYPVKLHEYLACGRPVVGTRIRSLEEFRHLISLATNLEQWSKALTEALGPDANTPNARLARQETAQRHDWNGLVENLARTIARRLGRELPESQFRAREDGPGAFSSLSRSQ